MIQVEKMSCKGCGVCKKNCPKAAIAIKEKVVEISDLCVSCGICTRVCPFGALKMVESSPAAVRCQCCPVECQIEPGFEGACKRYTNINGQLVRNRDLVLEALPIVSKKALLPEKPLITAVGAGTSYPCCRPAPYIVEKTVNDIDVVTVVTEAPLSYSGIKVKIDANTHIGDQGAQILCEGAVVGMVDTEEYGAKMLSLGGASILSGKNGFIAAKTVVALANGEEVELQVVKGSSLKLQVGKAPVIDGKLEKKMRVGCGSATIGMFAKTISQVVDEAIILDFHVIGLLSEHRAGEEVGLSYCGVVPNGRKSTRGRYFGEPGHGWGGTCILSAKEAVKTVDMNISHAGMRILVTETTGQEAGLLEVQADGTVREIPMTAQVQSVVDFIAENCEDARVSAIYVGGTGGSARAGVTRQPIKLSQAVHAGDVKVTIGGGDTYILPGGGINFMVDVEKVVPHAFTWVATPATVVPVEYTMAKETFAELGGHMEAIRPVSELKKDKTSC
ncbi:MAG: hnr [Firmicutes bacterium]|nr:hnr [Bacillota bacterium]MBP2659450.1 hnr [Bacillota bacterium]